MCFLFGKKKIIAKQRELSDKIDKLAEDMRQMDRTIKETVNTTVNTAVGTSNSALMGGVKNTLDTVAANIRTVLEVNEKSIVDMRSSLDKNLSEIRQDNEKRLGEIRQVVEEKLTSTLNERLSQTVSAINERLDAVNKGLGEMQSLTVGVTDLKKMLGNVKTRGVYGETGLANILENVFTPQQYEVQFNLGKKGDARKLVDFAVAMPGKNDDEKVYLPIDAKFPLEDYQRLVAAADEGNADAVADASKALENAIKIQAKSIKENYIVPPKTVDFALMYLPIEGLYAEVVRVPGLLEELRNKYKVIPVGPTTVTALLNSLQLGFRTLALQKSSRMIFDELTKFKDDFTKFGGLLEKAQGQVGTAGKTLEEATKKTNTILRKLEKFETNAPPELTGETAE